MAVMPVILVASALVALAFIAISVFTSFLIILSPPLAALATAAIFSAIAAAAGYTLHQRYIIMRRKMAQTVESSMLMAGPLRVLAGFVPALALKILTRKPVVAVGLAAAAVMWILNKPNRPPAPRA